jgi:uncharacterized protein
MMSSSWIQDLKGCLQIFYWAFFKPNTLNQKIKSIHPDLDSDDNPFKLQAAFATNAALRRYAHQVWLLTVGSPVVVVAIVAPLYMLFTHTQFRWWTSFQFIGGWVVGNYIARKKPAGSQKILYNLLIMYALIIFANILISRYFPGFSAVVAQSVFVLIGKSGISIATQLYTATLPMAFGVAVGVALGVALGVAVGVAVGVAFGVAGGVALGVALGVAFGVAFGVAVGVAFGVAVGVAVGVAFGVALGVSWVLGVLRIYFWIPEFFWMIGLGLYSLQGNAVAILRWLPPRFDQLIYLPLPFMAEIIFSAHQENPIAAEQTINYFITSTNQQSVAHQAMFSIAVATLDRCRLLADITNIYPALRNRIPQQEPIYGEILEEMLGVSTSVGVAIESTSLDRQIELLQTPITDLEKLRANLVKKGNAKDAPLFGPIINRWWQILTDHQAILEVEIVKSPRIPQKYLFGNALEPGNSTGRFKGRQDVFREIENILLEDQPPTLLLYGRRRTGKSSTLRYLPTRINANLVPLLVDIQGFTSMEEFVIEIIEQMTNSAKNRRGLNFPTIPKEIKTNPIQALKRWMTQVERQFPNKRFLLCMDEFERLGKMMDKTNDFAPLNFFRYTMQNCDRWILLFSGSHQLSEIKPYWSDCLIGSRCVRLSYLQKSEARELIQKPTENFPDIYEPAALDAILQLTRCQPYFVQVICYQIVEMLNLQERQRATAADVAAVIPKSIDAINGYFNEFWTELKEPEQELLLELVTLGNLRNPDKNILRHLIQIEVLEKTDQGGYRFQVPFVHKFAETQAV